MNLERLALLLFVSIAVGTDLCNEKIYNKWVVAGVLVAGMLCVKDVILGEAPWYFCVDKIVGLCLPLVLLMVFFSLGILGGGDVKLFSMIGAYVGWKGVLSCMALFLVPAAVMALGKMVIAGSIGRRFRYFFSYLQKTVLSGEVTIYQQEHTKEGTICLSVPIMIGVWMYLHRWFPL